MGRILCTVVPILLLAASVSLAGNTGKITGEVKDGATGEALVGANIVIQGTTQGSATNIDGYYVILNVPPGTYTLVASAVGFNRKTITNVSVSIDAHDDDRHPDAIRRRRDGGGGRGDRGPADDPG